MSTAVELQPPEVPSWFKGRQGKIEMLSPNQAKLTAPNQGEAYLQIERGENLHFAAFLRWKLDAEPLARTECVWTSAVEAWEEAFELYRCEVIY